MPAEVLIVEHQPVWAAQFMAAATEIRAAFAAGERVSLEHIGSTAVPGLCAKPVIDILLGADDLSTVEAHIGALGQLGYRYRPEYEAELPDRRYFVRDARPDARPEARLATGRQAASGGAGVHPRVHLHAVVRGGTFWQRQLGFRDALRGSDALASEYANLKRRLAVEHANDKAAYTEAKGPFIARVLAGLGPDLARSLDGLAPT